MESRGFKTTIKIACLIFALALAIISIFIENPKPLKYVSLIASITYFLFLLFIKLLWRIRFICRMLDKNDLNGKWACEITYDKGNKYEAGTKECLCIIKQDLLDIQVTIITDESKSYSISAKIIKKNIIKSLLYIYRSETTKEYRENNPDKYGCTKLDIIDDNHLVGEYWTNGKSSGVIKFTKKNYEE